MRGKIVTGLVAVGLSAAVVAGGVVAATQSSDEAALQPARGAASQNVEQRVETLLRKMTLDEKLDQIQLLSDGQINGAPDARPKPVGGVFSLVDPVLINKYQSIAVEESRLGIPILFAYDTIHGFRTIFPIPLGAASSFDPKRRRRTTTGSARASRPRSASSRSTARWSTSRTSRAGAASPRPAARTRTSTPCSRPRA